MSHPAIFLRDLMERLSRAARTRLRAKWRTVAMFRAQWPLRRRDWPSAKVTSSTQCRRFSIAQCPRMAAAASAAKRAPRARFPSSPSSSEPSSAPPEPVGAALALRGLSRPVDLPGGIGRRWGRPRADPRGRAISRRASDPRPRSRRRRGHRPGSPAPRCARAASAIPAGRSRAWCAPSPAARRRTASAIRSRPSAAGAPSRAGTPPRRPCPPRSAAPAAGSGRSRP